jgi:hypothetical protein
VAIAVFNLGWQVLDVEDNEKRERSQPISEQFRNEVEGPLREARTKPSREKRKRKKTRVNAQKLRPPEAPTEKERKRYRATRSRLDHLVPGRGEAVDGGKREHGRSS